MPEKTKYIKQLSGMFKGALSYAQFIGSALALRRDRYPMLTDEWALEKIAKRFPGVFAELAGCNCGGVSK